MGEGDEEFFMHRQIGHAWCSASDRLEVHRGLWKEWFRGKGLGAVVEIPDGFGASDARLVEAYPHPCQGD